MGQYYAPCTIRKVNTKTGVQARPIKWMYSHDYNSGLKLMEHSWRLNPFVNTFAKTLLSDKPKRVVWAGDYADPEYTKNDDIAPNLYDLCSDGMKIKPTELTDAETDEFLNKKPYLCNYDKKQYVNINNLPDIDGWRVHPLPLLTAEGNSRGGGDYHNDNGSIHFVGLWARDRVAFRCKPPKGFEIIYPNFTE
jgi:hypothetical protein